MTKKTKGAARTAKGAAAKGRKGGTGKGKKDIVRLRDWTREHRKDPVYRAKIRANAAAQRAQLKREAEIGRLAVKVFWLLGKCIEESNKMRVEELNKMGVAK